MTYLETGLSGVFVVLFSEISEKLVPTLKKS